ncbi:MAG: hypothetical protein ACTSXA_06610 [Candidatus Heimdallarchaeota archaeon]
MKRRKLYVSLQKIREYLLKYCELDTLAQVVIAEELFKLII